MSEQRRLKRLLKKICKNPNNPIRNKYPFIYLAILETYIDAAILNNTLPFGVNPEFYHMAPKNKNITFVIYWNFSFETIWSRPNVSYSNN